MNTKNILLGKSAFNAERETFLPINTDSEKKSLPQEGKADGRHNLPDSQALLFGTVEQDIAQKIAQTAQLTHSALSEHFGGYSARLLPIVQTWDPLALIQQIQDIPGRMKTSLDNMFGAFKARYAIMEPAWRSAKKAYETFRQEYGLIRPPDYLPIKSIILWFFCIIVAEASINATLLWELTGILIAFGQTILITTVNVLFGAALVGLCFRYKNHDSWQHQLPVLLCIPVMLAVLTFNLGVGHYRDALVEYQYQAQEERRQINQNWDDADPNPEPGILDYTIKAMASMKASPVNIKSILSGLLIIVGIGFFGFATQKWYSMFDPYPGYRKRALALEAKHKDYKELVETSRNGLDKEIADAKARVIDEHQKVITMRTQHSALIGQAETLQNSYAKWVLVLEKTQNHLLAVYRDSNQQARSEPAPKHFNNELAIDDQFTKPPEFSPPDLHNTEQVVAATSSIGDKIQDISDNIWQQFNLLASMQPESDA